MRDSFTPVMRALVAAALLLATATLMAVTLSTARAAGALAIGACGAFGESYDFATPTQARENALAKLRFGLPRSRHRAARLRRAGG